MKNACWIALIAGLLLFTAAAQGQELPKKSDSNAYAQCIDATLSTKIKALPGYTKEMREGLLPLADPANEAYSACGALTDANKDSFRGVFCGHLATKAHILDEETARKKPDLQVADFLKFLSSPENTAGDPTVPFYTCMMEADDSKLVGIENFVSGCRAKAIENIKALGTLATQKGLDRYQIEDVLKDRIRHAYVTRKCMKNTKFFSLLARESGAYNSVVIVDTGFGKKMPMIPLSSGGEKDIGLAQATDDKNSYAGCIYDAMAGQMETFKADKPADPDAALKDMADIASPAYDHCTRTHGKENQVFQTVYCNHITQLDFRISTAATPELETLRAALAQKENNALIPAVECMLREKSTVYNAVTFKQMKEACAENISKAKTDLHGVAYAFDSNAQDMDRLTDLAVRNAYVMRTCRQNTKYFQDARSNPFKRD